MGDGDEFGSGLKCSNDLIIAGVSGVSVDDLRWDTANFGLDLIDLCSITRQTPHQLRPLAPLTNPQMNRQSSRCARPPRCSSTSPRTHMHPSCRAHHFVTFLNQVCPHHVPAHRPASSHEKRLTVGFLRIHDLTEHSETITQDRDESG